MEFLGIAAYDEAKAAAQTAAQSRATIASIGAWFEKYGAQGRIAWLGHQLAGPEAAKTIRAGANGEPVVTDGPYVEAKEAIGGLAVFECESMEDAVEMSKDWASFGYGFALELRPVLPE